MTSAHPSSIAGRPSTVLRIAVLEDDADLRQAILLPGLRDFGFDVCGAGTAAELYRHMLGQSFDIVVLDIGLPDEDGITVARHLRKLSSDLGIVMLTGNRGRQDHLHALGAGADVYLSKPVDVEVLAATLHGLARRLAKSSAGASSSTSPPRTNRHWQLGSDGWCLLSPSGGVFALTTSERRLLSLLIEAKGAPVSREVLIAALSDNVYDFDPHRLEMLVHRLRRKAIDAVAGNLPLLTSRGAGYLFADEG